MKTIVIVIAVGLGACSPAKPGTDAPAAGLFDVMGSVVTSGPPPGVVAVAWSVSTGSPDYIYKFGEGTSTASEFMLSFSAQPPAAALNHGIGIGTVIVFPPGTVIPEGSMISSTQLNMMTGYSADHAIIYKATDAMEFGWTTSFGVGFSCGQCVREQAAFDSFELVGCGAITIKLPSAPSCNWS